MDPCDGALVHGYVTGALSEKERPRIENHLAGCDKCRQKLALLIRMLSVDLSAGEQSVVDRVEVGLSDHVPLPNILPTLRPEALKRRWSLRNWHFAAAGVFLLILVAVNLMHHRADALGLAVWPERTFEARLSDQSYSPFVRNRSGQQDTNVDHDTQIKRLNGGDLELGLLYLRQRKFDEAIAHLQTATDQKPSSAPIRNDLGVAYMESGRDDGLQRALQEFKSALEIDQSYPPSLFNIALVYERLGQFAEAELRLKAYLRVDSSSGWANEVRDKF